MTIYVGNLSFQAEREDLLDLFGQYGEVRQCSLPLDRETGRKRGFAFVELSDDAAEQKAIDDLQDVEWMGRMIRVNKATPREGGEVVVVAAAADPVAAVRAVAVAAAATAGETPRGAERPAAIGAAAHHPAAPPPAGVAGLPLLRPQQAV